MRRWMRRRGCSSSPNVAAIVAAMRRRSPVAGDVITAVVGTNRLLPRPDRLHHGGNHQPRRPASGALPPAPGALPPAPGDLPPAPGDLPPAPGLRRPVTRLRGPVTCLRGPVTCLRGPGSGVRASAHQAARPEQLLEVAE